MPSPSLSSCVPLSSGRIGSNTVGHLSIASGMPSPSMSPLVDMPVYTVEPLTAAGRFGTQLGSFAGTGSHENAGYELPAAVFSAEYDLPTSPIRHTAFGVPHTSTMSQVEASCATT